MNHSYIWNWIKNNKYFSILVYFFLLSIFLYRDLFSFGIIAFEDLIPFFSIKQLEQYHFSSWLDYTQNIPIRARYNFLFNWMRYVSILKYSIIITTIFVGFLFYYSIILLSKHIINDKLNNNIHISAIISSTYILFILLQAKITHFYTFILGIGFFFLSLSIYISSLFEKNRNRLIYSGLIVAFLLLINPSIQIIMLIYIIFFIILFITLLIDKNNFKNILIVFIVVLSFHLIPYLLYLHFSFNLYGILQNIFISYVFMKSSSLNILNFLSSAQFSVINKYYLGTYEPICSIFFILHTILCLFTAVIFKKYNIIKILILLYFVSLFFSIGFNFQYSGYYLFLEIPKIIPFFEFISVSFFTILRWPHRWSFLELYIKLILLSLSVSYFLNLFKKINFFNKIYISKLVYIKKILIYWFIIFSVLLPFFFFPFSPILSGNFGGALKPINIPKEMEEIKNFLMLFNKNNSKIVSYPIMGMRNIKINNSLFMLNDEFYNLYFNTPSIEGEIGSSFLNKFFIQLGHYLLYQNKSNVGRYFSSSGVKYIFFHNDTIEDRLPYENRNLLSSLQNQSNIKLQYGLGEYYLFEIEDNFPSKGFESKSIILFYGPYWIPWRYLSEYNITPYNATLINLNSGDLSWNEFSFILKNFGNNTIIHFTRNIFDEKDIVLSLLLKEQGFYIKPSCLDIIKFEKNGWKSAGTHFSLETYGTTEDIFLYSNINNSSLSFDFNIPYTDYYDIYIKLHAPAGTSLSYKIDEKINLVKVNKTLSYRFIPIYNGTFKNGSHQIALTNLENKILYVDLIYIIPKKIIDSHIYNYRTMLNDNKIFISYDYSEINRYISKLEYPKNHSIIYYCDDFYSPNMMFKIKDEYSKPIRAWYAGSSLLISKPFNINDVEVIHLPLNQTIKSVTLVYLLYIISFFLILLMMQNSLFINRILNYSRLATERRR